MNHVELLGVAGAGKSTVSAAVTTANPEICSLKQLHSTVVSDLVFPSYTSRLGEEAPRKALSYIARISGLSDRGVNHFSLKYPEMLPKTAKYIHRYTDDESRIDSISSSILDLVETYGIIDSNSTDSANLLIDEGFASTPGSVLFPPQHCRQYTSEDIEDYVNSQPVPDGIVFVRASPETYEERIRARKTGAPSSWDCLEMDSYTRFASESDSVAKTVADQFESRGAEILELDTEELSVEESATAVEQFMFDLH